MTDYCIVLLPVEEQIKKGDSYRYLGEHTTLIASCDLEVKPNLKKVEAFLCSRAFTQGDEVENLQGKKGIVSKTSNTELHIQCGELSITMHSWLNPWFKRIGPVSKVALKFINEGMLLKEGQFRIITKKINKCVCERPNIYRSPEQQACPHMVDDHRGGDFCDFQIEVVDCVEILCPTCETFH